MRVLLVVSMTVLLVASLLMEVCLTEQVSSESGTRSRMWVVKRRILRYASYHNRLPPSLLATPTLPRYDNSIHDYWRRPLGYQGNNNGTVTLISLGKDGRPGGGGEDADIVLSFPSHDADGRWSDELVDWLKK